HGWLHQREIDRGLLELLIRERRERSALLASFDARLAIDRTLAAGDLRRMQRCAPSPDPR
ncbi:MAG: hypothetical protein K8H90_04365, partial [Thermoanaerobaculia bacterium]|nr:hypothetical protein [Thermoanaerobaculia bacterium]